MVKLFSQNYPSEKKNNYLRLLGNSLFPYCLTLNKRLLFVKDALASSKSSFKCLLRLPVELIKRWKRNKPQISLH